MAIQEIYIPQMGEGLQEVVIVGFQKQPGDRIKRDDLIYSMETDKAVMEVESPYEGVLKEWLAKEGSVLPIGAPVARIETEAPQVASTPAAAPAAQTTSNGTAPPTVTPGKPVTDVIIPPRTRAHCKDLGISEEEMRAIPAPGGKLMPADVDAYLAAKAAKPTPEVVPGVAAKDTGTDYSEQPLSQQQRVFTSRIRRSAQLVVPGTMTRPLEWHAIPRCVAKQREQDFTFRPTEFQTFAWCVAQAVKKHPKFRSTLIGDEAVREYRHVNLGIAVARSNGELVTAVIPKADTLDYPDFVRIAQENIQQAREGEDQADADTQLLLTYMGAYGIIDAVPVLVAPAIAVLFLGATYSQEGKTWANMALTLDHRLINGVEGATFLKTIAETTAQVEEIV